MKICYIFSNYHLSHITGQAGLVTRLARKMKQARFMVSVISNGLQNLYSAENKGIHIYLIKGLGDFKTYFLNLFKIIEFLKKIKPDIIHVNGILMTIYVWSINFIFRIPLFSLITETVDHIHPFHKKLFYFASRSCFQIFVTSDFLKKQLVEIGVEKNKIIVVRIGLDDKFLKPSLKINQNIDVFYFGDNNHNRGFDIVVELAKKLKNLSFLISVRNQELEGKEELKLLKKLPNVKLLLYPYKHSLESLMAQSKLILLPFRWMLIRPPISLLEAMAQGKCIITSSMPGNEEIIKHNDNGIIANFNSLSEVEKKIAFLVKNKNERDRLGNAARISVQKQYSSQEYSKIIRYYALKRP